jgi:hypothetical protein
MIFDGLDPGDIFRGGADRPAQVVFVPEPDSCTAARNVTIPPILAHRKSDL